MTTCPSLDYVYRHVDLPLLPALTEMEVTGALIDVPRLRALGERIGERKETLRKTIEDLRGAPINLNSPIQVAAYLYDDLRLPLGKVNKKNPKGRSTDADNLERLWGMHPAIEPLAEYKKLEKLDSAFVRVLPEKVDREGRIHPSFNNTRVETGRLSCSDPNLQQVPAGKKLKPKTPQFVKDCVKEVRKAFIPRDGWKIVKYDQAAVEWRIIVCFANETSEIDSINQGRDAHCATVADWLGLPYDHVMKLYKSGDPETKVNREVAKTVKYGTGYGQSEVGLVDWFAAQGRPVTKDQAIVIRQRIIKPAVWEWIEETKKRATSLGYSESYFGRRIWNEDLTASERWKREAALREAVNAEVQGTAADVKKIADARIWREKTARRMRSRFILMVHDELVVESPEEEVEEMEAIMETIAPRVVEWQVPLSIETGVGVSWGECE